LKEEVQVNVTPCVFVVIWVQQIECQAKSDFYKVIYDVTGWILFTPYTL